MYQRRTVYKYGPYKGKSLKFVSKNPGTIEVEKNHFICDSCLNDIRPIGETREWNKVFNKFCSICGHALRWEKKEEKSNG